MLSHTTPTRTVNESKWNLLKPWELKPGNFGNVPKNIYIYLRKKRTHSLKNILFHKYIKNLYYVLKTYT